MGSTEKQEITIKLYNNNYIRNSEQFNFIRRQHRFMLIKNYVQPNINQKDTHRHHPCHRYRHHLC